MSNERHRLFAGLAAGLAATMAMTLFMCAAHRHLPAIQRRPLPPRRITDHLTGRSRPLLDRRPFGQLRAYIAHFSFGAVVGAVYGAFARSAPAPLSGAIFALGVWAVSYLGWVPAIGAMAPATRQPTQRVGLMLAAHVVWGGVLEATYREVRRKGLMKKDRHNG